MAIIAYPDQMSYRAAYDQRLKCLNRPDNPLKTNRHTVAATFL